jgi:hypothetical protein
MKKPSTCSAQQQRDGARAGVFYVCVCPGGGGGGGVGAGAGCLTGFTYSCCCCADWGWLRQGVGMTGSSRPPT